MIRKILVALVSCLVAVPVLAVDVLALWDFKNPTLSEQRFRSALQSAKGDEALVLHTQIARTYVFRKDFAQAREILHAIEPQVQPASAEVQVRYWLELGRTYASHQHQPESQTPEAKQMARSAFNNALRIAQSARLDGLAIDAIHMFAFIDTAPADQLKRGLQALALVEKSNQADAKRWEASIRSNLGEALYEMGRYPEALGHFKKSAVLREQSSNLKAARDAHWHIARVLRMQHQYEQALVIQLRLEHDSDLMSDPKDYIFEELALLYRAMGEDKRAEHYLKRAKMLSES